MAPSLKCQLSKGAESNIKIMGTARVALPPRYAEKNIEDDAEGRKDCFKACSGRLINNIAVSQSLVKGFKPKGG